MNAVDENVFIVRMAPLLSTGDLRALRCVNRRWQEIVDSCLRSLGAMMINHLQTDLQREQLRLEERLGGRMTYDPATNIMTLDYTLTGDPVKSGHVVLPFNIAVLSESGRQTTPMKVLSAMLHMLNIKRTFPDYTLKMYAAAGADERRAEGVKCSDNSAAFFLTNLVSLYAQFVNIHLTKEDLTTESKEKLRAAKREALKHGVDAYKFFYEYLFAQHLMTNDWDKAWNLIELFSPDCALLLSGNWQKCIGFFKSCNALKEGDEAELEKIERSVQEDSISFIKLPKREKIIKDVLFNQINRKLEPHRIARLKAKAFREPTSDSDWRELFSTINTQQFLLDLDREFYEREDSRADLYAGFLIKIAKQLTPFYRTLIDNLSRLQENNRLENFPEITELFLTQLLENILPTDDYLTALLPMVNKGVDKFQKIKKLAKLCIHFPNHPMSLEIATSVFSTYRDHYVAFIKELYQCHRYVRDEAEIDQFINHCESKLSPSECIGLEPFKLSRKLRTSQARGAALYEDDGGFATP